VLALDARIVIRTDGLVPAAIAPYPADLARQAKTGEGLEIVLRPIRPEDEPLLAEMVRRSDPADTRLRFLQPLAELPHALAARLSQIDYDREMAFVALDRSTPSSQLLGVGRLVADPENEKAEFAVMVRSDLKGHGLGYCLMQELVAHARRRGLRMLHGDVLRENRTMLQLAAELGFTVHDSGSAERIEVRLDLLHPA